MEKKTHHFAYDLQMTDLGRRHDREGVHDTVRVLLADLTDEQCTHAGPSATTERVGQLESLQTVAALRLLAYNIQDSIDQLGTLRVVTLGPVVAGTALTKYEVVWAEDLTEWTRADRVHCAWFQVNEHSSGHVLAACSSPHSIAAALVYPQC